MSDSMLNRSETKIKNSVVIGNLRGVQIRGTGLAYPDNLVKNEDLGELGCDPDWILRRTGITARYHVAPGESTSDLAARAGKDCLERSGVSASEIDLIIVSTMTPDHGTPSCASLVQAALGCQCGAIDMNAACSGYLYGLITGAQFVKSGSCRNVMVIGAEAMSTIADPEDKKTYPLFGDGAAATIVCCGDSEGSVPADGTDTAEGSEPGILAYQLASEGEFAHTLSVPGAGSREPVSQKVIDERLHYLRMDGRAVFKWAVRLIPEVTLKLLEAIDLRLEDLDLIVPHQANKRIIDAALETLEIPSEKIFLNLDRYGNTSAASVPICLHEAQESGRIKRGNLVMLLGFGGGLTWGGALMRW